MKLALTTICVALIAVPTWAGKVPDLDPGPAVQARGACDLTGYKSFTANIGTPVPIPDNTPTGICIGPISTGVPGPGFLDVVVELGATHSWVGDLITDVIYDPDCSGLGGADDTSVRLTCRPMGECADLTGATFGCGGDLAGTYFFSLEGDPSWEFACPATIPSGSCLSPDSESLASSSLLLFNGQLKGGCFWLCISDNAAADTGAVSGVTVWTMNDGGVPAEARSWGAIKSAFD